MYYHVDGDLVPDSEATVSVRDRGFMYGDAAFETLRAYGGTTFEWAAHRDRLERTCETLGMPDAVPEDLADRVRETLAANDLDDAYVRVSVTRGEQPGKLTPRPEVDPTVVVVVKPLPRGGVDGEPVWDGPAALRTVETRRIPDEALPADVKTHNYLGGILARLELRRTAGEDAADEALVRDTDGYVTEGATSNVFFVDGGTLHTPGLDASILPGVTRSVVLELAERADLPVETGRYRVEDIRAADEVFLTNTTWEVRPVTAFDGTDFEVGPTTERLMDAFDRRVERLY
jgi:branched-chain amino acid aminotransferase